MLRKTRKGARMNRLDTTSDGNNTRSGFTLIELLVVIAIIALLVSILLPSLNRAKELAKVVICASNLKNTALGFVFYSEDYDGFMPAAYDRHLEPPPPAPIGPSTWMLQLSRGGYKEYNRDLWRCPSYDVNYPMFGDRYGFRQSSTYCSDYYNIVSDPVTWWEGDDGKTYTSSFAPSSFILMADSRREDDRQQQWYILYDDYSGWRIEYDIHIRHFGKANTWFADGHLLGHTADELEDLGFGIDHVWEE